METRYFGGFVTGLGGRDIDLVLLATRHKGDSLLPVSQWPLPIYVCRLLVDHPERRLRLADADFELVASAELYKSEDDASQASLTTS
jgi:hypothetical protein